MSKGKYKIQNLHQYYKDKYMLAFYDKEDMLRYLFDNVRELHECLGLTDTKQKKSLNSCVSSHLSGRPKYQYIMCFKEPMTIHLIEVEEE